MKLTIQIDKENDFTDSPDYKILLGNYKIYVLDIFINYIQIYYR